MEHAIRLHRFVRGGGHGWGFGSRVYGYRVVCLGCDYTARVNGTKREATVVGNEHRRAMKKAKPLG